MNSFSDDNYIIQRKLLNRQHTSDLRLTVDTLIVEHIQRLGRKMIDQVQGMMEICQTL